MTRFEVEQVLEIDGDVHVFARCTTNGDFQVKSGSRLGGCPVRPQLTQPRALDKAGDLRRDLFVFVLDNPSDRSSFSQGALVELSTGTSAGG